MSETIALSPQEKLKTMLMQNFGGTTKSIMVFLKKAYSRVNYHKQALNKFKSTRKEKYKLSKLLGRQ